MRKGGRRMWKYYLLSTLLKIVRFVPARVCYQVASVVSLVVYVLAWRTRRAVKRNVRVVLGPEASNGQVSITARAIFRYAIWGYADLLRVGNFTEDKYLTFAYTEIELDGLEYLRKARETGRGIVFAGAHFAGGEMATLALPALGYDILVPAEPLEPKRLNELLHRIRNSVGREVYLPISTDVLKQTLKRLREGRMVGLIIDRAIQDTGISVSFFGRETKLPTGAAELAVRTDSLIIPASCSRKSPFKIRVQIFPAFDPNQSGDQKQDIRNAVLYLVSFLEESIRRDPTQWAILQPVWN